MAYRVHGVAPSIVREAVTNPVVWDTADLVANGLRIAPERARAGMEQVGDLVQASAERIAQCFGVTLRKAATFKAALDLGMRLAVWPGQSETIRRPADAFSRFSYMAQLNREEIHALFLTAKRTVIRQEALFTGSLAMSTAHPREVLKRALELNAAALILAHNHPSGDPEPSPEDLSVTRRIAEACRLVDIDLLDHIIVGRGRSISLKEAGVSF